MSIVDLWAAWGLALGASLLAIMIAWLKARAADDVRARRRCARPGRTVSRVCAILDALPEDRWAVACHAPSEESHVLIGVDGRILVIVGRPVGGGATRFTDASAALRWGEHARQAAAWVRRALAGTNLPLEVTPLVVGYGGPVVADANSSVPLLDEAALTRLLEAVLPQRPHAETIWFHRHRLLALLRDAADRSHPADDHRGDGVSHPPTAHRGGWT